MLGLRIWHDWSHESQKGLVVWHFQNVCVKWSFSSRQKIQFSSSLTPIFCRKLLVGKRLCKNLKLKSISFELIVQVFAAWKAFFQLTFLSVEEQMSLCHLSIQDIGFSLLFAISCWLTILDYFWLLRNVLKELWYCWCVPGICRCKDFTAETIPKNIN